MLDGANSQPAGPPAFAPTVGFRDQFAALGGTVYSGVKLLQSPARCWGFALHGVCPPGTLAVVAEADNANALANWYNQIDLASISYGSGLLSAISDNFLFGMPAGVMVVGPGKVIAFPKAVERGIVAMVWGAGTDWQPGATPFTSGGGRSSLADPRVGSYPLVRFYADNPGPIEEIGYIKGSAWLRGKDPLGTAPTDRNGAFYIPPAARSLLLHFTDDVPTARIVGAESASFEVWFRGPTGMWMHNPADDFTATARGVASGSHDVEVYTLPPAGADMFAVVYKSGNTFKFEFALTE